MINKVNSPQLLGATESQIVPSGVNEFFQVVHELLITLGLYIQYYVASFLNSCAMTPDIFREGLIEKSRNMGKIEDISFYKKRKDLKPFWGEGWCFGGSLTFLYEYFAKSQNLKSTASSFKGGIPALGVSLQNRYELLFKMCKEKYGKVTLRHEYYINQVLFKKLGLSGNLLDISASARETVRIVERSSEGSFILTVPTYDSFGKQGDFHCMVLVKTKNDCYLYDPNFGIGKSSNDKGNKILKRALSAWMGELSFKKTPKTTRQKISYFFLYVFNILRGHINPPFMKKINEGCQIIKVVPLEPQIDTNPLNHQSLT